MAAAVSLDVSQQIYEVEILEENLADVFVVDDVEYLSLTQGVYFLLGGFIILALEVQKVTNTCREPGMYKIYLFIATGRLKKK